MEKIDNETLGKIKGGSATVGTLSIVFLTITSITVFLSGIFKGITTPGGCHE